MCTTHIFLFVFINVNADYVVACAHQGERHIIYPESKDIVPNVIVENPGAVLVGEGSAVVLQANGCFIADKVTEFQVRAVDDRAVGAIVDEFVAIY